MPETQAQGQPQSTFDATAEVSLLDRIVDQGRLGRDAATKERGKELVKNFVTEVLKGTVTIAADTEAMINARIAQIDDWSSTQLNEGMHHRAFQHLAGHWRVPQSRLGNAE